MTFLVIDVGTSGLRAVGVDRTGAIVAEHHRELLPDSPDDGIVEFDAATMAAAVLELARRCLEQVGPVEAIGVTNQRASTIVWDRATGEPVGPGIGWQDLRTIGECLTWRAEGLRFAPNQSATKLAWLLDQHDPDRSRDLCMGTVDTWVIWTLTEGACHVTDLSNAAVTGLVDLDGADWDDRVLAALRIPRRCLPSIVDSSGEVGPATALGGIPITGIAGDQQASLLGQGCVRPGVAKITFGTGAMLDVVVGDRRPAFETRGEGGTFPIVAWRLGGSVTWGLEAIMLAAGTNVEWLRDDLGLIGSPAESHDVASECGTADGVVYVPAPLGLGSPHWDYGARGALLGLTRGSGRAQIVRAVLEGVAQRGADLVEATEADTDTTIQHLRIDGGMSRNPTFVQALADASGRAVEVSPVTEATTLGAAYLAGLATGTWSDLEQVAALWTPSATVEPVAELDRGRWQSAVERARAWFPELSALDF